MPHRTLPLPRPARLLLYVSLSVAASLPVQADDSASTAAADSSPSILALAPQRGQGGPGRGPGGGRGQGRGPGHGQNHGAGHGPDVAMRADQEVFHYLLEHHSQIRRTVERLDNGVRTLTESDNSAVAAKIKEHVAAMHERVKSGRGLRFWDPLFVAIFRNTSQISMQVEQTPQGVRVTETSADPFTVQLIQAHAEVVSQFVQRGFEEAHTAHPVPPRPAAAVSANPDKPAEQPHADNDGDHPHAKPELQFPVIEGFGGVVPISGRAELPTAGARVVLDITVGSKSPEAVNGGLERAARLLNLYGAAGLQASDLQLTLVLHGEATRAVLSDVAFQQRFKQDTNPSLPLIQLLQNAGVEIFVCSQALHSKGFAEQEVSDNIPLATSAMTVIMNRQADGFSYLPVH